MHPRSAKERDPVDLAMKHIGFRKKDRSTCYARVTPEIVFTVTDASGQAPPRFGEPVLVYQNYRDGRQAGEPAYWSCLELFITAMGGGKWTANIQQ